MANEEWNAFEAYITPLIIGHEEAEFSKDSAASEAEKVVAKLKEAYLKTSETFRRSDGKFKDAFVRMQKRVEKNPNEDIYTVLHEFKMKLKAYRPLSSEAAGKRTRRDVQKLNAHISKLNKMIKKLEEKELDLDDMENAMSPYIHLDKLKRRLILAWRKRCSLLHEPAKVGRPIEEKLPYAGSKYPGVNERVCRFINSRRGCNFPNYKDVLKIVKCANTEDHLNLKPDVMEYEAKRVFEQVGKSLKKLREADHSLCTGSHLTDAAKKKGYVNDSSSSEHDSVSDPAVYNSDLKNRLQENKRLGDKKMESLIEDYVKRQEVTTSDVDSESNTEDGEACSYTESDKSSSPSDSESKDAKDDDDTVTENNSSKSESTIKDGEKSEIKSEDGQTISPVTDFDSEIASAQGLNKSEDDDRKAVTVLELPVNCSSLESRSPITNETANEIQGNTCTEASEASVNQTTEESRSDGTAKDKEVECTRDCSVKSETETHSGKNESIPKINSCISSTPADISRSETNNEKSASLSTKTEIPEETEKTPLDSSKQNEDEDEDDDVQIVSVKLSKKRSRKVSEDRAPSKVPRSNSSQASGHDKKHGRASYQSEKHSDDRVYSKFAAPYSETQPNGRSFCDKTSSTKVTSCGHNSSDKNLPNANHCLTKTPTFSKERMVISRGNDLRERKVTAAYKVSKLSNHVDSRTMKDVEVIEID